MKWDGGTPSILRVCPSVPLVPVVSRVRARGKGSLPLSIYTNIVGQVGHWDKALVAVGFVCPSKWDGSGETGTSHD